MNFKGQKEIVELDEECLLVQVELSIKSNKREICAGNEDFIYQLCTEVDSEMRKDYLAREVVNRI